MSIFTTILQRTSSVKSLVLLFVLSHLVLLSMMLFTFPEINSQIGSKAFDLQTFGYSKTTAESIVGNLNEQTTQLYLFPQLTFLDLLYPGLLALFLSSLLFRLVPSKAKLKSALLLIPFVAMIFDYAENICVILMISRSVQISEWFVFTSGTFTVLKSLLTTVAWVAILVYVIKWLLRRIRAIK